MKVIFALIGTGLLGVAVLMGSSLAAFCNLPSLLIVVGGMSCFTLAHHAPQEVKEAIMTALSDKPSQNLQRDISTLATVRKTTYGSGIAGTLIGLVQMLQNLEDPSAIGPAMAVALLTALYSVIIVEFIVDPMSNRILSRSSKSLSAPIQPGANSAHAVGMVFCSLLCLFVLLIAFQ